ncbi:MAG: response regulator transcription factor [Bacteroidetes bacterium]|nr:response regulator transcription factor [Bacteroidota bacterium]MBU1681133.1 response regulator transcription factor [Bacteroidota bacterium]MBU2507673.1 response regulator transcription factor [Bacteroidota bacterium]
MKILVVEDEVQIADSLKKNFLAEGYSAQVCYDGEDALKAISNSEFDAILLDWRIPKISGIEVCKRVREAKNETPIILLTALSDISNKIQALNLGADDYITKPFSFEEVLARIQAVIRRYKSTLKVIEFDNNVLDLLTRNLRTPDEEIKLTEKEFELLKFFLENKGNIVTKEQLSEDVWKLPFSPTTNIVEVTVKNLRKKLEANTNKKYIKTAYGEGYIFISE